MTQNSLIEAAVKFISQEQAREKMLYGNPTVNETEKKKDEHAATANGKPLKG